MEQQQQQTQQQQQNKNQFIQPLFQDMYQRNLIKDILNPEDVIEFIERNFRGQRLNNEGEWEEKKFAKPLKEAGINTIVAILRCHLPKMQTLSNLEANDIIRMARSIRLNIIEAIHQRWEDFTYEGEDLDEPDLSLCDQIVLAVDHNVFANLRRALGGQENKLLRTVYKSVDSIGSVERINESQGNKNWFSNLFSKKQPQQQQVVQP